MALIVEDGTGLPNSECYCSLADLVAYITRRNLADPSTDEEKEAAIIISAQDWIDGQHEFAGDRLVDGQAMDFPRTEFDRCLMTLYRPTFKPLGFSSMVIYLLILAR